MEYRVIYDVLDDGLRWGAPTLLSATFFFGAFVFYLSRRQALSLIGSAQHMTTPSKLMSVVLVVGGFAFVWMQFLMFGRQQQCKKWTRTGQYTVEEGTVSNYERSRNILRFRVADTSFSCANRFGGFWGEFTAQGVSRDTLRNGLRVRIAHREGYILRIELAAEPNG